MQKVFSIFAQNLAYYNEGYIAGDWIDLPQSPEVIDKYLKEVVKVDDEHEEYEIADIDNIEPFPYSSIQWASVKDINELAIIFSTLDNFQKEAVLAHLVYEEEEYYGIDELINICLQADNIAYYQYNFEGIEHCENCSPDVKMGYTMAEEIGLYYELEKLGATNYFDFEKYGESYSYNHQLLENGYLIQGDYDIDLNLYSKEEIQEKVNQILQENLKEREVKEIEI
ncbi:antirestriction protein ArdA [uncultured Clostridium sp.]|uniref:antirestriction protein ArdA n=1 Tax=uncultured Clostridium sp. TaxID=59620 RepID=UPI002626E0A7|nr:antirestriction protein ArdA [uncultured Clostridium sp.]MCI8310127.1 antirestriction protein ArdA [Clostridia bacterium]